MLRRLLPATLLLVSAALHAGQGTKQGSPEENLPPNIVRLTHFGERSSWSVSYTHLTLPTIYSV